MSHIVTTSPITLHKPKVSRPALPGIYLGSAFAAMSDAIRQAFAMAYVAPFSTSQGKLPRVEEADLEGRDPNW